ncbi:hypothetical protein BDV95DRAFT_592514 [Massariosphaeria phaeospora]|uniref:Uncharacterized protein n=1 Tax=Massariosphaeria phaeospora TaxID=100035 RepID=A0A7C8MBZ4_9PLEO|nr:hypothetical protein BDV95DRAFT_592514 [Massariosphaeria phaeospora]
MTTSEYDLWMRAANTPLEPETGPGPKRAALTMDVTTAYDQVMQMLHPADDPTESIEDLQAQVNHLQTELNTSKEAAIHTNTKLAALEQQCAAYRDDLDWRSQIYSDELVEQAQKYRDLEHDFGQLKHQGLRHLHKAHKTIGSLKRKHDTDLEQQSQKFHDKLHQQKRKHHDDYEKAADNLRRQHHTELAQEKARADAAEALAAARNDELSALRNELAASRQETADAKTMVMSIWAGLRKKEIASSSRAESEAESSSSEAPPSAKRRRVG